MRIHSVILAVAMGLMSAASVAGAVGFPNAWQRDAQWVAIVPSGYVADIELLRAYHQSKGMSAVTWKLSDLDLYYGGHGPNEVRAALLEAWQTWAVKPRFVVIATPDAKVSPVPANVIPNFYDTDDEIAGGWGALVPTMMPFMDMNGDNVPEIVVGRLPFSSHLDFVRYYAKVSSHDADTESGMKYRYNGFLLQDVDLDGNSGDWVRDLGNQLMSADPTILRPVLRTSECMGSSMLARDGAIALWNNAPGAVFVLGTAAYWNNLAGFFDLCGTAPWTPSLLGATPGSYPVLVAAICGMGTTDAPVATSCASPNTVAEQLLASSVGSVAVIGPTRTTYQYNNFEFEREVLRVRSEGEHHWGDVYRRALEAMIAKQIGAEDHVREYVYLGDPAVLANATPVSGCPVVDAMSESGWIEENTILGDRATGRLGLDAYRIVLNRPGFSGELPT